MKHTLREYTGLVRTPSSMAWLIKKRASLQGRIEHKLETREKLKSEIRELRKQLKAIDEVIRQHEVTVDPEAVRGRRPRRDSLVPHGQLGRFLLEKLREAAGNPRSTTDLAIAFMKSTNLEVTMFALRDARNRVRARLKGLVQDGIVVPLHGRDDRGVYTEGYWTMVQESTDGS